jgi:Ni,Fe-hydrogenase maturation factor
MNEDLAWQIVRIAFRSSRELQDLLALLKERASAEEYQVYASGIARAIDAINDALLNPVTTAHPEFVDRIEAELDAHGQID